MNCQELEDWEPTGPEADIPKGWETILLVEDEGFVREVTSEVLESAGYTVLKASNATEALQAFGEFQGEVHLLLTDVIMPGKSGRELAQELRATQPGLKTIFMSGYSDHQVLRQDARAWYVAKPFSVESLARTIRRVLEGKDVAFAQNARGAGGGE